MSDSLTKERWDYLFDAELQRARNKFPNVTHGLAALMEEVGELAKELMENPNSTQVLEESVQIAVVAYRIASEGDMSHHHSFLYQQYKEAFNQKTPEVSE